VQRSAWGLACRVSVFFWRYRRRLILPSPLLQRRKSGRTEGNPRGRPMGVPFCTRCDTFDGILIRISRTRGKEAPGLCPAHPANRHCQQNFIQRIGRHSGYPVIENPLHLSQKTAWHKFLLGIPIESLRFKKPLFLMWGLFAVRTLNQPPDWSAMITSSQ
jgi:hypothetical protein